MSMQQFIYRCARAGNVVRKYFYDDRFSFTTGRECVPLEYDDFLDLLGKNSGDVTWLLKHTANVVGLNPMHVLFFLYAACLETSSLSSFALEPLISLMLRT